jgi:diguanylate cyclase (GGDEF)-like protein
MADRTDEGRPLGSIGPVRLPAAPDGWQARVRHSAAQSGVELRAPGEDRLRAPVHSIRNADATLVRVWRGLLVFASRPPANNRSVRLAAAVTVAAAGWFAVGPDAGQMLAIRAIVPGLAGLTAVGQWRLGADRRLPAAAARFWLVLSLALLIFTAGMVVDFVAVGLGAVLHKTQAHAGEALFYPIAGLFAIVAFVVYPTALKSTLGRIKISLDISIVLFSCATFVWYFMGSRLWDPSKGWQAITDRLVLPALTVVAGFAVLRITLAGANVICRRTMYCFVFAAAAAAISIFLQVPAESAIGRLGSMLQVLALGACVLGVAIQRGAPPPGRAGATMARPGWRRPFSVLPYVALAATIGLLLLSIAKHLNFQGWVVAGGVLGLCVAVVLRQLTALWENSRLLASNRELTADLHHHAYHDHLTGLPNRALFTERVADAIARTRPVGWRGGGEIAVLFIDLDEFKIVNDSLGHHVGDELLVAVAQRLRETTGDTGTLCRLGGDEFAILLENTDAEAAAGIARDVVAALGRPLRPAGIQVRVEASVGIALAASGEPGVVELLRNADVAMYAAKRKRGSGWRIFEPTMLTSLLRRHDRRAALLQAVERDELEVHYQPIVDLARGTVVGAEALVRWRVDGELVLADDFVPLAEESGLIAGIDANVLVRACHQAAQWRACLGPADEFDLHVNLSPHHLHRPELVADIQRALRVSGLPARHLTLEITEPGLSHDEASAADRLRGVSRLGVQLAIDDFGTGYSSLSHLRAIPADIIKIDKVFTAELLDKAPVYPVAKGLIVLASTLGIQTIAEGIEHAEQVDRLIELGCVRGQGYHVGRPMTAASLTDLLTASADRGPRNSQGLVGFRG